MAKPPSKRPTGSRRGDTLRAQIAKFEAKIAQAKEEMRVADKGAIDAYERRLLLGKGKYVAGGFFLKLPAAVWTDELRQAVRDGASGCRSSDRDVWAVLLTEFEKVWTAQPDAPASSTPVSPDPVIDALSASGPRDSQISQDHPVEVLSAVEYAIAQTDDPMSLADTSSTAPPTRDFGMEVLDTLLSSNDDGLGSHAAAPPVVAPVNPVTTPHPDKETTTPGLGDPHQLITVQEFLALGYHGRKPYVAARNPVMALLTEEEFSSPGILNSERGKMLAFREQAKGKTAK